MNYGQIYKIMFCYKRIIWKNMKQINYKKSWTNNCKLLMIQQIHELK